MLFIHPFDDFDDADDDGDGAVAIFSVYRISVG